ncbi:MAG: glycoside hydrolase family 127 protein [Isosphaeraceae bacterium]|nr:glycoside hydrolase family 127 protein [Isosphaeraceae bacterium]
MTETSASPHVRVRSVGLADVRWTRGFWADWFATCREAMIPHLWEVMRGTEPSQFYHNFRIAAGLDEGKHRGPSWNDGDFYKWIEAASAALAITPDEGLDHLLDEVIGVIARAQRADGYLHTPVLIRNRLGDDAQPFQDRLGFEAYNLGHLMTAACIHHRATGKTSLLRVALKAADFLDVASRSPSPSLVRCAVCPSHYMGVIELYRETRNPKYRDLACRLLDLRDQVDDGTDDNQDRIPFRRQTQAVGHAVRANYLYAGAADVYAETGDPTLLAPLRKIWEDVVFRKMYITGACGALYDGASPDGVKDQKVISRVHQAYGRAYQLPNSTAHNETCAAIGNVLWNWRMLQITGEARFADVMELTLYNGALAGVSLDGTRYFYTNTLRQLDRMPVELRWSRRREPFISCFCCPPNLVRTIAEVAGYAYGRLGDAVWVHLYGGSTLDTTLEGGGRLRLTQETDYPWDGRVTITIAAAPARPLTVRLRIPGWAEGATVRLNGEPACGRVEPGSYFELKRPWAPGDVLTLTLPMRVRLMQAHPLVEEARNQVAVQRGPIVYCLESIDLPEPIRVSEVIIPRGITWKPRYEPALLGGITLLEGRAAARPEGDWSRALYRELNTDAAQSIDLRLIPYYAWGNRGPSEMTVWIPLGS